jgi:tripeptide aminopeptidase
VTEIERAFAEAIAKVTNAAGTRGELQIDGNLDYESFRLDENEPCVQLASRAVQSFGRAPELAVTNGGLDANWLSRHGIPTVSLGCGQLNQHMANEALSVTDFQDACRIALALATGGPMDASMPQL